MLLRTIFLLSCLFVPVAGAQEVVVGAAVSLKEAMEQIAEAYRDQTGQRVQLSFGSSGQVLGQIRGGAPIDAIVSASNAQMDSLQTEKLIAESSRRMVASNRLVLIVPRQSRALPAAMSDLLEERYRRIAIGEPHTVPAGQYAWQALQSAQVLQGLRGRIVHGSNVRQVLSYVSRGEVDAGIVYRTDALEAADRVTLAATVPEESHDLIQYSAAVVRGTRSHQAATRFLDYLSTPAARQILQDRGFGLPAEHPPPATGPATAPSS